MRRRSFLRLMMIGGSAVATSSAIGCGPLAEAHGMHGDPPVSLYGRWMRRARMPAFLYDADQDTLAAVEWDPIIAPRTRRNWLMVGNRAIRLQGANDGTVS